MHSGSSLGGIFGGLGTHSGKSTQVALELKSKGMCWSKTCTKKSNLRRRYLVHKSWDLQQQSQLDRHKPHLFSQSLHQLQYIPNFLDMAFEFDKGFGSDHQSRSWDRGNPDQHSTQVWKVWLLQVQEKKPKCTVMHLLCFSLIMKTVVLTLFTEDEAITSERRDTLTGLPMISSITSCSHGTCLTLTERNALLGTVVTLLCVPAIFISQAPNLSAAYKRIALQALLTNASCPMVADLTVSSSSTPCP